MQKSHSILIQWALIAGFLMPAIKPCFGSNKAPATQQLAILNTTDTSELGLAKPLQEALGKLAANTQLFTTYTVEHSLKGFTSRDLAKSFEKIGSDLMSFTYMERSRISIFLFDVRRVSEFIVSTQALNDPPEGKLSSPYIEEKFQLAFAQIMSRYLKADFQPLPGSQVNDTQMTQIELEDNNRKAKEARRLFRELSALEYRPIYVGAAIGMSRLKVDTRQASTINFGAYGGYRIFPRLSTELGVDLFSYALLHIDLRYQIPFAEKYVGLSLSMGISTVLSHVSETQGFPSASLIPKGTKGYGPGLALEIPLLGANLRGEIRYYAGNHPIFLGTYGILYSL